MDQNGVAGLFQRMVCNQLATLDGLKECVMKLSRHASAFGESFVETCAHGFCHLTKP
jgi:hypothetical protein